MYSWHQSNNLVYVSFNIPSHVTKADIQADISSSTISLGVKGYGLNCEGTLYSSIKGSKWAIKDGVVQVQMDKQQTGVKWNQLLSEVTESNPKAIVLFEYEPTSEEELALTQHEVINILSKDDSGWWEGSKQSLNGVFASNFAQEFPSDYQPPEDFDASNEATKSESEQSTITQVSRVGGFNMSMGSMDELKNKLANRKTATYTSADIEEAEKDNHEDSTHSTSVNTVGGGGGFVAVHPSGSRGGLQRAPGKILLNNRQSTILSGSGSNVPLAVQPIEQQQPQKSNPTPIQPMVQLKSTTKKDNTDQLNSSNNSIPATTSKESQSTKESTKESSNKESNSITSMFKKPLKKIQSISAFTGSHSHEEKSSSNSKTKAKVIFDFETKESNELNLKKGDIVVILAKDASGWWQGINQSTNATGWFSNTFVEEIKEVEKEKEKEKTPLKQVRSPPPKIQPLSSSSSQPQTVEAKLQSLSETPKLETARKAGVKGRKPPSRIRASYLLSDEEKQEREKLKQSFYSHVVSSQKEMDDDEENDDSNNNDNNNDEPLSRSGGSFSPPPQTNSEKPSKPPPPKRLPQMNLSNSPPQDTPSPPLVSNKPPPPSKSSKPSLSSSDGYEPSTPSPPNSTTSSGDDVIQKSPVLARKFPLPPQQPQQQQDELPASLASKPPPLKPTPKPRVLPPSTTASSEVSPAHEVNFKANLKPPKSTSPPISNSEEVPPTQNEDITPQPTAPQLKRTVKPPVLPPTSQPSSELANKLSKFSDLAEGGSTETTPTKPLKPTTTNTEPSTNAPPTTKPAVRPPLKKPPVAAPSTTAPSEEQSPSSPPIPAVGKPKITPRSVQPTSAPSSPPIPTGPPTHKRNLSNPNQTVKVKPANISLPTFNEIIVEISNICNEIQNNSDNSQESTTGFKHIYPTLADSFFSVAVCSTDGQFWGNDDQLNDQCVPMFQAIYPFMYSILCEEIGVEEVSKWIDNQARPITGESTKPINSEKKAHNPFTLSGQLIISHLFTGKYPNGVTRIYQFLNIIQQLVNSSSVSCDMVSYLSQKSETGDEVLVGHLLKSSGLIKQPDDVLEFFYQLNSIQLNSKQISVLAATLAADGICPFSPQLKLAPKNIINKTNDLLKSCDSTSISTVKNSSNNNNNSKIIPIISDSGVLMIVVPGLMGISIVSPTSTTCNNNNTSFTHYPNENHIEFFKKLYSILDK